MLTEMQREQGPEQGDTEVERDAFLLSRRERWLFALPSFAWVVLFAAYPVAVNTLLDPVLTATPWQALPLATRRILAIAQFIQGHYWQFGLVGLAVVFVYFQWISRNRVNVYLFDMFLVIGMGAVLWRTYQGLSAAGVL